MDNVTSESKGKSGKQGEEIPKIKMNGPDDSDGFVVNGAIIKCDQMSDSVNEQHEKATDFCVLYPCYMPEEYPGQFRRKIRRLFAVQADGQTTNQIRFATVKDCTCQRDVDDGKAEKASIISMGYCRLFEEQDNEVIKEKYKMAQKYGTCYCLMSLVSEWTNSRTGGNKPIRKADYSPHCNAMKFYTSEGLVERLTMGASIMCTRGGRITLVTSGQIIFPRFAVPDLSKLGIGDKGMEPDVENMTLDAARGMMTQYLRGELDEDTLNGIIPWVADNCGLTVSEMKEGEFAPKEGIEGGGEAYERSRQFNDQILAWTYYWNCKIQEEYVHDFQIDPNIVKAMIAQESSFGSDKWSNKNSTRNVMQSLSVGNDVVWIAAGINPYDNGMFSTNNNIEYKTLDGVVHTDGCLVQLDFVPYADNAKWMSEQREKYHFEDIEIIGDIFELDGNGRYRVVFDKVTSNMSIAVGIGALAYKIDDKGNGSVTEGIKAYNSEDEYLEAINKYLEDMYCKRLP